MGTPVKLPPTLLYPVEILEVLVRPQDRVKRQQRLLKFKYWNRVPDGVAEEGEDVPLVLREFYGFLESPHDGTVSSVQVRVRDRINDGDVEVLAIAESCDHSVQYGGLCALCGQSLDQKDYLGYNDVDRAPIAMSHDTSGLTVSYKEAERIETRSTRRLLADRRLVLVVDLDQTVIHASVSPEIGELAADPANESLAGVQRFALRERAGAGAGGAGGSSQPPSVTVAAHAASARTPIHWTPQLRQADVRWYYIKMRPGLQQFLEKMAGLYEMHVYTMATRHYALEVTRAIDPTGKYFADRILSRDTSGSLLYKDLKRLFPVSTNMVTIIDDRGDVWNWSPHLIRCVPYHFWSNTGDINSQFLPKRSGLVTPTDTPADDAPANDAPANDAPATDAPAADAAPADALAATTTTDTTDTTGSDKQVSKDSLGDTELAVVGDALTKLHAKFYAALADVPPAKYSDDKALPNIGRLLPAMKEQVFDGCVLLFSGFFPVNLVDLDSADIVQWVRSFGAVVVAQYIPAVTHVVSRNPGTLKARQAAGQGKCVVQIQWVFRCLEKWACVDETPYLWQVPNPITGDDGSATEQPREEPEEATEVDANIANGFVRSLQRGDVNWDEMDEELEELLEEDPVSSRKRRREESDNEDENDDSSSGSSGGTENSTGDTNNNSDGTGSSGTSAAGSTDSTAAAAAAAAADDAHDGGENSDLEIDLDDDWD